MDIKYSLLLMSNPYPFLEQSKVPTTELPFNFDSNTRMYYGNVADLVTDEENAHWRTWLGSIMWDELDRDQKMIVLSTCPTEEPEILNAENKKLGAKLYQIVQSLPFVDAFHPPGDEVVLLTGKGVEEGGKISLLDIREVSRIKTWTSAKFSRDESDYIQWEWKTLSKNVFFEDWKKTYEFYAQLLVTQEDSPQLVECIRSFQEALKGHWLEFKIPNLVRAAESIIALKPGQGKDQFARRCLALINDNIDQSNPLLNDLEIQEELKKLYQLRSDCAHGKPFAHTLKASIPNIEEFNRTVSQLEYLAEFTARIILKRALFEQEIREKCTCREDLEKAWAEKEFSFWRND